VNQLTAPVETSKLVLTAHTDIITVPFYETPCTDELSSTVCRKSSAAQQNQWHACKHTISSWSANNIFSSQC